MQEAPPLNVSRVAVESRADGDVLSGTIGEFRLWMRVTPGAGSRAFRAWAQRSVAGRFNKLPAHADILRTLAGKQDGNLLVIHDLPFATQSLAVPGGKAVFSSTASLFSLCGAAGMTPEKRGRRPW